MEQILYSCQQNRHLRERERERKGTTFSPYSLVNREKCHEHQQVNLTVLQLHSLCWECWLLVSGIQAELLGAALEAQQALSRHWVGAVSPQQ